MILELVAEVPLSLLNSNKFPADAVVWAECNEERTAKIYVKKRTVTEAVVESIDSRRGSVVK